MATITIDTNDLVERLTDYLRSEDIGMLMEDLGIPGDKREVSVELMISIETVPGVDVEEAFDSLAEWARSELEATGTYVDDQEVSGVLRISDVSIYNVNTATKPTVKKVPAKKAPAKKAPAKKRAKKTPATKKAPARKRTIW